MAEKIGQFCGNVRISHCVEPIICFVSMILQIVGFSTNAWVLQQNNTDGRLTKFGLWSTTICYDLDCKTKTHMDEHKELMAKGYSSRGIQYAFQVGNEVNSTVAVVCVVLCFCFSILYLLCKVGRKQIQIGIMLTSLLSGVLMLTVVGYSAAELLATTKVKQHKIEYTYYVPWSLLISGFGAIIIAINGLVLIVFVCRRKTVQNDEYETVKTKENITESVPHQCADDYDPPDYNEVDQDSEHNMV